MVVLGAARDPAAAATEAAARRPRTRRSDAGARRAGPRGRPPVSLRVLRPALARGTTPALLWIHGGGLISGSPEQDDRTNMAFVRTLGITVAAVRYRLAPSHRGPAVAEDRYPPPLVLA